MSVRPSWRLPDAYMAVPLIPDTGPAVLRVCVVVRKTADELGGHFVGLDDECDARVMLGALIDPGGTVHRWLRVAIQDVSRAARSIDGALGKATNRLLDARWSRGCAAAGKAPAGPLYQTGFEDEAGPPTVVDLATGEPVVLSDPETGAPFALCTDDRALEDSGLPAYGTSLHRYLWLGSAEGGFVPATEAAPGGDLVKPIGPLLAGRPGLNPTAGRVRVTELASMTYEEFVELLSGGAVPAVRMGRAVLDLGVGVSAADTFEAEQLMGDGWLFQGHHGRWGRLLETYHLKLRLFADACRVTATACEQTRGPLLDLDAEAFGVQLGEPGCGLPLLWTARTTLRRSGVAVELPLEAGGRRLFLPAMEPGLSVYRATAAARISSRGAVRIRELLSESEDDVIAEGTFSTNERLDPGTNDLLWLQLPIRDRTLELFATIEHESTLAAGEWRLRTLATPLSAGDKDALLSAAGVPLSGIRFELVPLLSTPYDMYSLFVLGVRTFLVDQQTTLPKAVDEILSLAREVGAEPDVEEPLPDRIRSVFARDPRWIESLGPHRLTRHADEPGPVLDLVPTELWFDTIALLIRMAPGSGRDSYLRDLSDVSDGGPHLIFDAALEALDALLLRTRSLIVIDWSFNREIGGVIRRLEMGLPGARSSG